VEGALGIALAGRRHTEHGHDGAADLPLGSPAPAPEDVGDANRGGVERRSDPFRAGRRRIAASAAQLDHCDSNELALSSRRTDEAWRPVASRAAPST
jgi:hypothetical protein